MVKQLRIQYLFISRTDRYEHFLQRFSNLTGNPPSVAYNILPFERLSETAGNMARLLGRLLHPGAIGSIVLVLLQWHVQVHTSSAANATTTAPDLIPAAPSNISDVCDDDYIADTGYQDCITACDPAKPCEDDILLDSDCVGYYPCLALRVLTTTVMPAVSTSNVSTVPPVTGVDGVVETTTYNAGALHYISSLAFGLWLWNLVD